MSGASSMVCARGIVTQFGQHRVHDGLDLDIARGRVIGLVGGSGTGKSVLLRIMLGLMRPKAGEVWLDGRAVIDADRDTRAWMSRNLGMLFQDGALFSSLNVRQNIEAPMREHLRMSAAARRELALLRLAMVGLDARVAELAPSELSGGMRKRVALARALALEPQLLFLDEPTAGLDPIAAAGFDELLGELKQALGLTVIMVTHDLDSLFATCDEVAVLGEGRILAQQPPRELLTHPHPWIQRYFNGPRGRAAGDSQQAAGMDSRGR